MSKAIISVLKYLYEIYCRLHLSTNMMWPSQNFHLYNGTVIKIKENELINN